MAIISFPPVQNANEEGLLAIGGDLEVESLVLAYSNGIFPWPISTEYPLTWFCPHPRGILEYKNLYISKKMKRVLRQNKFRVKYNTCFEEVIINCASSTTRKDEPSTWITEEMISAYIELFHHCLAFSAESFLDNKLVGGIYGVCIGRILSGESMFFLESNASKVALITLMEHLHSQGIEWLDTQMLSPVVESMGGSEIPREEFFARLKIAKESNLPSVKF